MTDMTDILKIGGEVIPAIPITQLDRDKHPIKCLDCGGWPIEGGAVFIPVVTCRDGSPLEERANRDKEYSKPLSYFTPLLTVGFICELCFVWRLERRAEIVSKTSTPASYYAFSKAKPILREKMRQQGKLKVGKVGKK